MQIIYTSYTMSELSTHKITVKFSQITVKFSQIFAFISESFHILTSQKIDVCIIHHSIGGEVNSKQSAS